jgi:hypothetical protein
MMARIAVALIALGIAIMAWGAHYPEFYDPNWEHPYDQGPWMAAMNNAIADPVKYDAMATQWFDAREKALTPRDACFDRGLAVFLLGLTLLALSRFGPMIDRQSTARSPETQGRFVFLCSITWCSFVPGEWAYYIYTSVRGDYPWFGDIITIPCAGVAFWGVIGLPVVIIFTRVIMRETMLPVPILYSPVFTNFGIRMLVVFVAMALSLGALVVGLAQVPTIVPSTVCTIYLLLIARAAIARGRVVLPIVTRQIS